MAVDNQLLKQFDEMESNSQADSNYLTAMGVVGLQKAVDDIQKNKPIQNSTESAYTYNIYNSIASSDNYDEDGSSAFGTDRDFESIVDKLRSEIFYVRIVDALSDIVRPLADRIKLISLEEQQFGLQNHTETLLYYREIVDAINRLGTEIEEGFVNKMVMEYRKFMRNPALSILKGINTALIKPMTKVIGKILFGGRERTDTEKIVGAIDSMSEFLQRGSIDKRKNIFERLRDEGVVGTSISAVGGGVLSGFGMGRGSAQEAEQKRSEGKKLSIREKFALSQYRGEIEQFGRQGGILSNEPEQEKEQTQIELPKLDSILDVLRSMSGTLTRIEAFGYDQAGVDHQRYINVEQFRMSQQRGQMQLSSHVEDVIDLESEENKRSKKSMKLQKDQLDEAEETNRKLFMQTIMSVLGTVTSTVASLATGLGGGLATMLGLKGMTKGKGSVLGNIGKNVKGGGMGKFLKRVPILGSLIAGGSALSLAMNDDMSGSEKKTAGFGLGGSLAGGLGGGAIGGKLGATIGTMIAPGLGTAIGGGIGVVLGGVGGAILGEEAMIEFEDEITNTFKKGKQILIDGWSWVSETYDSVMNKTRQFGRDIGTSFRENIIDPVVNLKDNVLKTAMGLGSSLRENIIDPIIDFKDELVRTTIDIGSKIGGLLNSINPFSSDDKKPTTAVPRPDSRVSSAIDAQWRSRIENERLAQEGSFGVRARPEVSSPSSTSVSAEYDKQPSINTSNILEDRRQNEEARTRAEQTLEALRQIGIDMKRNTEYQKQQLENTKKTKSGFDAQPSNDTLSVMGG